MHLLVRSAGRPVLAVLHQAEACPPSGQWAGL